MKRLIDSSQSDFARSLLRAGIEDGPPPENKAKLAVALGVSSGLSLLPAKAFAWLSTTGGKSTLAASVIASASASGYYYATKSRPPAAAPTTAVAAPAATSVVPDIPSPEPAHSPAPEPSTPSDAGWEPPSPTETAHDEASSVRPRSSHPRASEIHAPSDSKAELHPNLQAEIALVDQIRVAAERGDARLKALLQLYTRRYPEGQFRPELQRLRQQAGLDR